ncbi:probable ribosome biogenesis protein RLP24 isoform X1 [Benincasa hispida]|uniref:probable ribosome biogenesis protein RLP24 isoform X1 n=2 Tax=Benincasa hispida TaxID=102211 RepID=UPI001900A1B6|nr:probable ribosome biogenesis protein RLP24 isoform X1 [Benincasa hispida]
MKDFRSFFCPQHLCSSGKFRLCYLLKKRMRLEKCWFCSSTIYPGHGIQFVRNDATIFRFCRSKCHKNFKMKRNPRKVKWTKAYRRLHGKDMTQDSTFEFERKRNRPERYDRNLTEETLKAIKKIDKVRANRESRHIARRHQGKKAKELGEAQKELDQSISLVKAPSALKEDPSLTLPKIKVKVVPSQAEQNQRMEE